MKDTVLSIAPSSVPAPRVPEKIAAPPTVTVMKTLATNASPSEGTTPVKGAMIAPARPASADPNAKVIM